MFGGTRHGTSEKLSRNASHSLPRFQAGPTRRAPRRPVEVTVSPTVLRALGELLYILGLPARSRLLLVMHFVIPISSGLSR